MSVPLCHAVPGQDVVYDPASTRQRYSLIFPVDARKDKILLGYKKRGFGAHLWNGFGGKPEFGEDMLTCAMRELTEESGIVADPLYFQQKGRFLITFPGENQREAIEIVVFVCHVGQGTPIETEEMVPQWFDLCEVGRYGQIPYHQMWPEASVFLPEVIKALPNEGSLLLGRVDYVDLKSANLRFWSEGEGRDRERRMSIIMDIMGWRFGYTSVEDAEEAWAQLFVYR